MARSTDAPTSSDPGTPYDPSYHRLFGHRDMVLDLLRHFAPDGVAEAIHPRRPLVALNVRHHLTTLDRREGDRSFRVPLRKRKDLPGELIVHLEFQSSKDPTMELRLGVYEVLLWQELGRLRPASEVHPTPPPTEVPPPEEPEGIRWVALLPVVLYNGDTPWTQAGTLRAQADVGSLWALVPLQPDASYHLIDIRRLVLPPPDQTRGPCDVLFHLEQLRDDPRPSGLLLRRLLLHLPRPHHADLRDEVLRFILNVLRRLRVPFHADDFATLDEPMITQFEKTLDAWSKHHHDQGLEQGLERGRAEDAVTYAVVRLERALTPEEQGRLTQGIQTTEDMFRLYRMSPEELEAWLRGEPAAEGNGAAPSSKPRAKRRPKA